MRLFVVFASLVFAGVSLADVVVSGQGAVPVTPDNAVISVSIRTTKDTIRDAVKHNSDDMNSVLAVLKEKVNAEDVCTHSFNVSPKYETVNKNKVVGYVASNSILITVKDTSKTSELLGLISDSDKNNTIMVNSVSFVVSNKLKESVVEKCRELAVKDAKARAEVYAKSAGVSLGAATNITESQVYVPSYASLSEVSSSSPPLSAGQTSVRVGVTVVFAIK